MSIDPPGSDPSQDDPLRRFRNWRGFLLAAIVVNVLYVYGSLGHVGDAGAAIWYKVLIWLPFNFIASVLYYVFMVKLSRADGTAGAGGTFYVILCLALIVANWLALFLA